jgi:IS1 family transposase
MFSMARVLSTAQRVQIVSALVEGNSLRATARMAGVSRNTVNKLLLDLGAACAAQQGESIGKLQTKRVEVDEIWSFVGMKQANVTEDSPENVGDVWTFVAIDADSKLCVSWLIGSRDTETATNFLTDVEGRLARRVQLTTDGHAMYLNAVDRAFDRNVDYAQLVKRYGADPNAEHRYSPAKCIGCDKSREIGRPNPALISTSYVERSNLTMRMSIRRFTRLTNAFSKKLEQHCAAIALHFTYYNLCRPHSSIRTKGNNRITPAMAAGLEKRQWKIEELLALLPPVEHRGGRPTKK